MTSARAEDEVVELCSELIRFDTSNTGELDTTKGEREAADYVAAKLDDVGLDYERVESGAPGRDNVILPHRRVPTPAAGPCSSTATWTWCPRIRASGRCTRSPVPCRTATCGAAARWT